MSTPPADRRTFLKTSALAAAGGALHAAAGRAGEPGRKGHAVRLGGPAFAKSNEPEQIALAHKGLGYRAAYCPGCSLEDRERLREIQRAFAKHDIVIAEVGRWCNLMEADPQKRAANLKTVTEGLALAEAVGAPPMIGKRRDASSCLPWSRPDSSVCRRPNRSSRFSVRSMGHPEAVRRLSPPAQRKS